MPTETNPDSELPSIEGIYPTSSDATETLTFSLPSAAVGTFPIVLNIPYSGIISTVAVKSSSGSGTVSVLIDDIALTGVSAVAASSTEASYSPTDLNYFTVGQDIILAVVSASSLLNLSVTVGIIRGVTSTASTTVTPDATSLAIIEPLSVVIPAGETLIPITFAETKLDSLGSPTANYKINPEPLEDLSGADPTEVVSYTVIAKSSTGMSVVLSGPLTTTSMVLRATIVTDAADSDFIVGGGSGGSGGSIASTTLPLRGDGAGGASPIIQQSGDVSAGLVSLGQFSSTPTLSASNLTGTIAQARLGTGSSGAGTKFLADDQTYKTPADATVTGTGFVHITAGAKDAASKLVQNADVHASAAIAQSKLNLNGEIPLSWLGTTDSTALQGDDSRVLNALQPSGALSEFTINAVPLASVRSNIGLGTIATRTAPVGTVVGTSDAQTLTNKTINGPDNTITNIAISSIADYTHTTLNLTDPATDKLLMWNDTTNLFDWCGSGYGVSLSGTTPNKQFNYASAINSKSADYTTVLADSEKTIYHPATDDNPRTFTIDSNANVAYVIGTKIHFINDKNTLSIAITADTMVLSGSTSTGTRTLATTGTATAQKVTSTRWVIHGVNLT